MPRQPVSGRLAEPARKVPAVRGRGLPSSSPIRHLVGRIACRRCLQHVRVIRPKPPPVCVSGSRECPDAACLQGTVVVVGGQPCRTRRRLGCDAGMAEKRRQVRGVRLLENHEAGIDGDAVGRRINVNGICVPDSPEMPPPMTAIFKDVMEVPIIQMRGLRTRTAAGSFPGAPACRMIRRWGPCVPGRGLAEPGKYDDRRGRHIRERRRGDARHLSGGRFRLARPGGRTGLPAPRRPIWLTRQIDFFQRLARRKFGPASHPFPDGT